VQHFRRRLRLHGSTESIPSPPIGSLRGNDRHLSVRNPPIAETTGPFAESRRPAGARCRAGSGVPIDPADGQLARPCWKNAGARGVLISFFARKLDAELLI
jgi:hypothetical protein